MRTFCFLALLVGMNLGFRLSHAATLGSDIYPVGKIFPFSGYSGNPEREAAHGFNVFGPVYGQDQDQYLKRAEKAGLAFIYRVGIGGKLPPSYDENKVRSEIRAQVKAVKASKSICWWYVIPEELRWWKKAELRYLEIAREAILAEDEKHRPVYTYEPNSRLAKDLKITGAYQDLLGKGSYVKESGHQASRSWVKFSMLQQKEAVASTSARGGARFYLMLPEMYQDPDPSDDSRIPAWVRHDVYLGLMNGAKGVVVFSLFKRPGLRRTYDLWYQAYSQVAQELTGPLGLGQLFLNGTQSRDFKITQTAGEKLEVLDKNTPEAQEVLSTRELSFHDEKNLFAVNSSNREIRARIAHVGKGSKDQSCEEPWKPAKPKLKLSDELTLSPYEVLWIHCKAPRALH